jgi:hypothetical protein
VIQFNDQNEFIIIEDQLFDYLKKQYQLCFTTQFSYRIGVAGNLSEIPFLNEIYKLDSIEYKRKGRISTTSGTTVMTTTTTSGGGTTVMTTTTTSGGGTTVMTTTTTSGGGTTVTTVMTATTFHFVRKSMHYWMYDFIMYVKKKK